MSPTDLKDERTRALIRDLMTDVGTRPDGWFPVRHPFLATHKQDLDLIRELEGAGTIRVVAARSVCSIAALRMVRDFELAERDLQACLPARKCLDDHFTEDAQVPMKTEALVTLMGRPHELVQVQRVVTYLGHLFSLGRMVQWLASGVVPDPARPGMLPRQHPLAAFVTATTKLDRGERPRSARDALQLVLSTEPEDGSH